MKRKSRKSETSKHSEPKMTNSSTKVTKQTNNPIKIDDLDSEEFQKALVEIYGKSSPRFPNTIVVLNCGQEDSDETTASNGPDNVSDSVSRRFTAVPVLELARPKAKKYTCQEFGSLNVIILDGKAWILVSDIVKILAVKDNELQDRISSRHFKALRLFGHAEVACDFVSWEAVSLCCTETEMGRRFIAWMTRVILTDLADKTLLSCKGISAVLLHAMTEISLEYPDWKAKFFCDSPDLPVEAANFPSKDFLVPLHLAHRYVVENSSYYSMLAYLAIREYEDSEDGFLSHSSEEITTEICRLCPDSIDRISARALHYFLKDEQPFDTWKSEIFGILNLVKGHHYFTDLPSNNPSRAKSEMSPPDGEDVRLSIEAAIRMGAATPTLRGRKIADYFSELNPPVRVEPIKQTINSY